MFSSGIVNPEEDALLATNTLTLRYNLGVSLVELHSLSTDARHVLI